MQQIPGTLIGTAAPPIICTHVHCSIPWLPQGSCTTFKPSWSRYLTRSMGFRRRRIELEMNKSCLNDHAEESLDHLVIGATQTWLGRGVHNNLCFQELFADLCREVVHCFLYATVKRCTRIREQTCNRRWFTDRCLRGFCRCGVTFYHES